jgi:hypothetical protein
MQTNQIKQEKERILGLADSMANAAADFKGHNYELFIKAREELKESLDRFEEDVIKNN